MSSGKQLFVSDMDGTLLGADSLVSPRSAAMISELSRQGALITVATARTPGTVEPLLADTFTVPPAVVMTGAAMWDRAAQRYRHAHLLDTARAQLVSATLLAHGLSPMVYEMRADGLLALHCAASCSDPTERRFVDERSNLRLKLVQPCADPAAEIAGRDIILILATGPEALTRRALPHIEAIGGLAVSHYTDPVYPGAGFIEVFTAGVNKAAGVLELKRLTGADSVTVFGDNLNDLPMMRVADRAIAVANALPEVKAEAHEVIGPNTADSVAEYIARNI